MQVEQDPVVNQDQVLLTTSTTRNPPAQVMPGQMVAQQDIVIQGQAPLTTSMLAVAPPDEQKKMLGERLFPLVQRMYPDLSRKITWALLDLDNTELLHMLEDHNSLREKVSLDSVLCSLLGLYTSLQVEEGVAQEEKQELGKSLFPLVERMYPDLAKKIMELFLSDTAIDTTEMMWMLEDHNALSEKVSLDSVTLLDLYTSLQVQKAVSVLQDHQGKNEKK